ncbi:MAG: hypothetical protein ABGZ17_23050, partial [Planctomycetaceae bacterium]
HHWKNAKTSPLEKCFTTSTFSPTNSDFFPVKALLLAIGKMLPAVLESTNSNAAITCQLDRSKHTERKRLIPPSGIANCRTTDIMGA